ncbi:MAG: hypothetical protein WBG02_04790 [Candidatus Acidiferrum sp.]
MKRSNQGKEAQLEVALEPGSVKGNEDDLLGFMAGKFEIVGDIESPIEDWEYSDPTKNLEE